MEDESSLLKIISEKLVKPSSPTPPSSRYYKFCAFDQFVGDSVIPLALFYPKGSFHGRNSLSRTELFEMLETSLSKTLTYYYPFAGRYMDDDITVDCNDAGVQLLEVQVQSSMSEILDNRAEYHPWNLVFLDEMYRCVISHVVIQLNYFECGGICIIVYLSHKLGDGTTLANFVNDWAAIARESEDDVRTPSPFLSGASIFPPSNAYTPWPLMERSSNNPVTRRFVFSSSSISELKTIVITETEIKNPTRVEVVTAFIFKSLVSAAKKLNSSSSSPSSSSGSYKQPLLMQVVNVRPVTIPPLSEQMVGNFVNNFLVTLTDDDDQEKEMEFSRIVMELRKSKVKFMETHRASLEGNEFLMQCSKSWEENEKEIVGKNFDMYVFSSWFRFALYEADFGFGKPIFVCLAKGIFEQTTVLMATPNGDGITAFITLKPDHMSILNQDKELLAYASLNPKICTAN